MKKYGLNEKKIVSYRDGFWDASLAFIFFFFINVLDKDIRCIVIKLKKGKILGS